MRRFKVGDRVRLNPAEASTDTEVGSNAGTVTGVVLELPEVPALGHEFNYSILWDNVGCGWADDCDLVSEEPATPSPVAKPTPSAPVFGGAKDDTGKLPISLVPTAVIKGLAAVLRYGAYEAPRPDGSKGYGSNNWQALADGKRRYYDAACRHMLAYREGERIDGSGLHHLLHAMCSLAFLYCLDTDQLDPPL